MNASREVRARWLKNDALGFRGLGASRLDIQRDLGRFIKSLPNPAILDSRTFYDVSLSLHLQPATNIPRYLTAPISFALARPSSYEIAFGLSFRSSSFRRSHFSAVRTIFTPGEFSAISVVHLDATFSNESRLSTYAHQSDNLILSARRVR